MALPDVAAQIQAIDSTVRRRCHCGTKAKWTASLRLKDAQIKPAFQHEDLCDQHAEQFAAINHLSFPPSDTPPLYKSER